MRRGWDGEAYFATVADSAESLARFGPPGSGPGTPTPGFDLVSDLLAAAGRWLLLIVWSLGAGRWPGPCRCWWVLVPDRGWSWGCSQYIFRLELDRPVLLSLLGK